MSKSCVIVSGGTAGHVLPSKEIAEQLREKGYHIHWIGYGEPMEYLQERHLITYYKVRARSPRSRYLFSLRYFQDLKEDFLLLHSLFKKESPDFVLLTGNFIGCLPGMIAKFFGIRLYLYEQNALLGQAHRLFYPFSQKVFWGMPSQKAIGEKNFFTGQPLRKEVRDLKVQSQAQSKAVKTVLIFGGSLGADFFNTTLINFLAELDVQEAFQFIHSVGSRGAVEAVQQSYDNKGLRAVVVGYMNNIASLYEKADFIISRAGALSLSEIAYIGKKALIIPMPNSVMDHQKVNALFSQNAAIEMKEQDKLTSADLRSFLDSQRELLPQEIIAQLCLSY